MKRVGIDFGTSTTLISYRLTDSSEPEILPIGKNFPWMPSVVSGSSPILVGEAAQVSVDAKFSVKSDLTLNEELGESSNEITRVQVKAIIAEAIARAKVKNKDIFKDAKVFLGCPALWTSINRKIIADIGNELGIDVDITNVIDEPVAAGVQWVQSQWKQGLGVLPEGKTLVFDAGGGTLDIAYLDLDKSSNDEQRVVTPTVTVLSAGSLKMAGDDADKAIRRYLLDRDSDLALLEDPAEELLKVSRSLKEALSDEEEESVNAGKPFSKSIKLTRVELEQTVKGQVQKSMDLVRKVIKESILRNKASLSGVDVRECDYQKLCSEVKNVLLVGGFSKMLVFETELKKSFGLAQIVRLGKPQQSVAEGLTYGDSFLRLNMPRPPISFFVTSKNIAKKEVCVYEAYSPIYYRNELLEGRSHLAARIDLSNFGDGDFSFHCEIADRKRTLVPFNIKSGSEYETFESITVTQDIRSDWGHAVFVLYATGEICIRGLNKEFLLRVKLWPSLSQGKDITSIRLEAERQTREEFGNQDLEAWRIPTG